MNFALKGYKQRTIHGAHATGRLTFRGCFHLQAPQPVDNDGGAPEWVADMLDKNPDIEQIAISWKDKGIVWSRMKEE